LAHAQQFVGVLKGNMERSGASRAFSSFLNGAQGKMLKENDGGDLLSAIQKGPLDKMMYSYRLKPREGGSPSQFVTTGGMKGILDGFPVVDVTVRRKLDDLYQGFSMSNFLFMQATPEQCDRDDLEEVVEEISNTSRFTDCQIISSCLTNYQTMIERRAAEERILKLQDKITHVVELAVKDAHTKDLEKQLAVMHEREKAAKEREQAVRVKEELEKKLAEMEDRERSRVREAETAAQLQAKDKELARVKRLLDIELRRKNSSRAGVQRVEEDIDSEEEVGVVEDASPLLQVFLFSHVQR